MCKLAWIVLFCCAVALAGCGGGSTIPNDSYYEGTWTNSEGQSGTMVFRCPSGTITGTINNATTKRSTACSGAWIQTDEPFSLSFAYPGGEEEQWSGVVSGASSGGTWYYTGTLQRTYAGSPSGTVAVKIGFKFIIRPHI